MKLRHVRAVAVFGIAVFALTGARGSHGASCGGGHGSSSNSSSSGSSGSSGSTSDGSSTTGGSDNSTSTSTSTSGGTSVPNGSSRDKAERDIKIDGCKLEGKNLVARLTVTNSGMLDATYDITMKFRGDATSNANLALAKVTGLKVAKGASAKAEATTPYTGKGDGSEYKECVVVTASKSTL
ncbi:hypothetical protein HYE82_30495 [Streptomyces sp. BR123]|uniref:hypothetical protein n=1 Tax=Streptomyces sp. BR123 TaxID=2749828 RepID=UPI0015C42DD4|nr:hypothetical protein [Streptomyces sp. BR123]NXY98632.1 hypothetical protein [Streptomyces sp. BR123]